MNRQLSILHARDRLGEGDRPAPPAPPVLYDDHLLAWMGHKLRLADPLFQPDKVRKIRAMRRRATFGAVAHRFGISIDAAKEICGKVKLDRGQPVESDRGDWWANIHEAAKGLGRSESAVRMCITGRTRTIKGGRRSGIRVWYSVHLTREAFEAARAKEQVPA